jgi:peptidoglycan hydrolase-like protein with peptidoglycan-binding domain
MVSAIFNRTLRLGMTNDDVKRLQELFAADSEIYPEGIISGYFGQLTRNAVRRFQCKYDIICSADEETTGYGLLGPKTRVKLAEVFSQQPSIVSTTPAAAVSAIFTKSLDIGMQNDDVKRLQQLLATDSEIYPEGLVTGYFGRLTQSAVQKFQKKYGVVSENDSGYGYVGPKTRAKLQEVFAKGLEIAKEILEESPASSTAESQIESIQDQIRQLLEKVKTLQLELEKVE